MFAYYFRLGLRNLRRHVALTALMVMAIGFGVAASMTTYALFRATSSDPIPWKSSRLYAVQIDNRGPQDNNRGEPPDTLAYLDASALMRAHRAKRQTALYQFSLPVVPDDPNELPFRVIGYAVYADAFPMFDVPFLYGQGWSAAEDEAHAAVAVISRDLNDQLFQGANSVGKQIVIGGRRYRITGVMDRWSPQPLYFDVPNEDFGDTVQVFAPFSRIVDLKTQTSGGTDCNGELRQGWESLLQSECNWLDFWVELPDRAAAEDYRHYLEGYAAQQRQAGRFRWAPNVRLRNVVQWLDYQHVVPPESRLSLLVSLAFLLICLVTTVGLLLAKFMRRAGEISVRRALGAPRREIYLQFLIEAGAIGLAGGVLGLALTGVGVLSLGLVFDENIANLARLDIPLVALTLAVAVLSTLLAAFYPTWRAARVQPALQLKSS